MMLPPASRLAQKLNPDARALLTDGAGGPSSHQQSVVAQQLNTQNVNNFTTQRSQMAAGIAAQAALDYQRLNTGLNQAENMAMLAKLMVQEQSGVSGIAPAMNLKKYVDVNGIESLDAFM